MNSHVRSNDGAVSPDVDVVVVGAGFAGLYQLKRLRDLGLAVTVLEAADDVGGTWYWNRYPGARCDIQSIDYSYSWDPELATGWEWSERYATQPEILRYLQHVADKHDLRRDIRFSTRVQSARWNERDEHWRVRTDNNAELKARFFVMATGCLSLPKTADIAGLHRFGGEVYFTNVWPHEGVDFTGKRVGVVGTGSSGVQSIPIIAEQASSLTVFQRTANYSIPAHNGPLPDSLRAQYERDPAAYRDAGRWSRGGVPMDMPELGALQVSAAERAAKYDDIWQRGELVGITGAFNDIVLNADSNETLCEYVRTRIRSIVDDPETAERLCPKDHHIGTKRACLDTNYFQTYNLPHVRLVDLRSTPIESITESGIATAAESFELDAIVFATGFDAMTGAIVAVDITGRDSLTLREKWAHGPRTYLGLTTAGFPNFFTVTGPGSPSVLSNMVVSIEQHVEWITSCIAAMRRNGFTTIEPTPTAEAGWVQHVNDFADITLFPRANSWYMGANVPGKPRVFLPYVGGVDTYRKACDEVASRGYFGFVRSGPAGSVCEDGVIRRLQGDVMMFLEAIAKLGLPSIDTMSVAQAREFFIASGAASPPGPAVAEVIDGKLRGADGDLTYRLYRPASAGPHPIVAYFHGGGWVGGDHGSDDPFCRELCLKADSIIVSVGYRHAPEQRFPAAAEDGFASIRWIARHASALGGRPGQLAVCGWSAGGNVAAVACQMARDAGGPAIAGQVLINPVTDCDFTRSSYVENAEGYMLTTNVMRWFWDHYCDAGNRADPRASPLRAADLTALPPALVVTAEFDPLRDEGAAYAAALGAAGVPTRHLACRGQIHTSVTAVGVIASAAAARKEIADALRSYFDASVAA